MCTSSLACKVLVSPACILLLIMLEPILNLYGPTQPHQLDSGSQHCVALADVADDFAAAADHKHPKIKLDSLKLLQVRD